jgi:hypothetical protein
MEIFFLNFVCKQITLITQFQLIRYNILKLTFGRIFKCFASHQQQNFDNARAECQKKNMDLVRAETLEENIRIQRQLAAEGEFINTAK